MTRYAKTMSVALAEVRQVNEKYDLYHKSFSDAMQHAYDYAQKKLGITVDKNEIDRKVATGPKKPTEGKTNKYRLKGKGGNLQIQVYNKGGSKPFELNMYKEEFESDLDELKMNDPKLNKIFDKLKPKMTVQIKKSSTIKQDKDFSTYLVVSKNTLRNGTEKITLKNRANPTGVKSFLYRRDGKVTFAIGDMGASIDDIKESIDERVNPMTLKDIERMVKDRKYKGNTSGLIKDVKKKYPDEYESDIVQDMMKKHAEMNEQLLDENFRKLAMKGIGTETKKGARVGLKTDYYLPKNGDKSFGKITRVSSSGYEIEDEKTKKTYKFKFYVPTRKEETELDEGINEMFDYVLLDKDNKIVARASGANAKKDMESSKKSAHLPPMRIPKGEVSKMKVYPISPKDKKGIGDMVLAIGEKVELDEILPAVAAVGGAIARKAVGGVIKKVAKGVAKTAVKDDEVSTKIKEGVEQNEGMWSMASSPKEVSALKKLMSRPIPVGDPDSEKSTKEMDALYGLLGDDELFDDIGVLQDKKGAKADARPVILKWFAQRIKDNYGGYGEKTKELAKAIGLKKIAAAYEENDMTKSLKDTILKMRIEASNKKDEGNAFGAALKAAKDKGDDTFVVAGKTYKCEDYDDNGEIKEFIKADGTRRRVKEGDKRRKENENTPKIVEDSDDDTPGTQGDMDAYQKKRKAVAKKFGVSSCSQLSGDKKKACYTALDKAHVADHEEQLELEKMVKEENGIQRYFETKKDSLRDSILNMWKPKNEKKDLTKSEKDDKNKVTDTGKPVTPIETAVKMPKVKNEKNRV